MLFNSFNFIVIYPLLFIAYYAIPARYAVWRNAYLLLVSLLLYMMWKPISVFFLLYVITVTYFGAILLHKTHRRKIALTTSIVLSLLPLVAVKYLNFINHTIEQALELANIPVHLQGLNWMIPIGISFFTLQALGYLLDVYRGKQEVEHDFISYALFVSFFPCIVSGPINRASVILPQIHNQRTYFDYAKAVEGLRMLLWGMFMKVVIADRAALYVDTVFTHYSHYTGLSCFVASVLYSIQIYTDFAGYSLMAIGVGKTLGFDFMENFRRPYFAISITDFWRRLHISLSSWLRDYIYIPLGGNRCSRWRNYWNIFVTFLVSGIWHGANWTFIVWGCIHGICQVLEKMFNLRDCQGGRISRAIRILFTFLIVNFAWIFFRMPTLTDACAIIGRIFNPALPLTIFIDSFTTTAFIVFGIAVLLLIDCTEEFNLKRLQGFYTHHAVVRWSTYICAIVAILLIGVFNADQFIYANF